MNNLSSLMAHYQENPNLNPNQALTSWTNMASNSAFAQQNSANTMQGNPPQNHQMLQQHQNLPPGVRTPSSTGQPGGPQHQFMSPAMTNALLPNAGMNGSPHLMQQTHTPSPASHPMVAQHSQQGTNNSATASVNTSPNVNNKRRRSAVKDGDDVMDVNGAAPKVKQSPRPGNNKRLKNN